MITLPMRETLSMYSDTGNLLAKSVRRASIPSGESRHLSKQSSGTQFRLCFDGGGSLGDRQTVSNKNHSNKLNQKNIFNSNVLTLVAYPLIEWHVVSMVCGFWVRYSFTTAAGHFQSMTWILNLNSQIIYFEKMFGPE